VSAQQYERALTELSGLREVVDDFFEHVMVMSDDVGAQRKPFIIAKKIARIIFVSR